MYQDPEHDKYAFEHEAKVNWLSRLSICKSICCKIPFAISRQGVEEGIIRWEFGRSNLIAHGDDERKPTTVIATIIQVQLTQEDTAGGDAEIRVINADGTESNVKS
jgi:hypothetical protein